MKRIKPKPIVGFILNPFGVHARSIEYANEQLRVNARRGRGINIANLAAAPLVTKGFGGSILKISVDDGTGVSLRGAKHTEATVFSEGVEADWIKYNTGRFETERFAINEVLSVIAGLAQPSRYPSASLLSPVVEQAKSWTRTCYPNSRRRPSADRCSARYKRSKGL